MIELRLPSVRFLSLVFVIVVGLAGAAFASLNQGAVALNLYFFKSELPLSTVILLAVFAGVLLGLAAMLTPLLRARRRALVMRRQADLLEEELNNLRTIPLKD